MAAAAVLRAVLEDGREPGGGADEQRLGWVRSMRQMLSPPKLLAADGGIEQDFFTPNHVIVMLDGRRWGDKEKELLYQGLERHGVGKWGDIREALLPKWDETTLRVKASKLFGSQSLARYAGWRGPREAVEEEYRRNRALGERLGCWKAGALVEDDQGSVKRALQEAGAAEPQAKAEKRKR